MMELKLVMRSNPWTFKEEVNKLLANGFVLHGELVILRYDGTYHIEYLQFLVKK